MIRFCGETVSPPAVRVPVPGNDVALEPVRLNDRSDATRSKCKAMEAMQWKMTALTAFTPACRLY